MPQRDPQGNGPGTSSAGAVPVPAPVRLLVARIGRAHGIRGELTVQVHTDDPDRRFAPGEQLFTAESTGRAYVVRTARDHNGVLLLTLDGVVDRTAAEALRGQRLYADVEPASEHEDDAWYEHELVGLRVLDTDGIEHGTVTGVEHLPAQDLLVIRRPDGETRLVPLVTELVPEVDIAGGRVIVNDRPGLLRDVPDDDPAD